MIPSSVDWMADGDDFLNLFLLGSAIAWIVCGLYVAKPNLHGIKFEEGTCNITSVETIALWQDFPTCSCGKSCTEEYPCLTVRGYYWDNSSASSPVPGTFHSDYKALTKKCFYIPDCKKQFTENSDQVYKYYNDHVNGPFPSYTNITFHNFTHYNEFPCWGYENTMYFDHSYNVTLVYVSLIIPGVLFLIAVICSILFGTDSQREFLIGLVMLPLLVIGGILTCLWEMMSECLPNNCVSCLKSIFCCKCMKKRQDSDAEMDEVSVRTERTRRNSEQDSRRGSLSITRGPSFTPRRRSLSLSDISLRSGVFAPGPTYDVTGADGLPPPPSYDEAIATGEPNRSAPLYDDVVKRS